ncbi:hypothetical protein HanIR_Chr12g0605801 [Helianthus annuus]|nr:hypothetical protein HanIR_Chr12g0605801 [Helianthus annuus]
MMAQLRRRVTMRIVGAIWLLSWRVWLRGIRSCQWWVYGRHRISSGRDKWINHG